jgi:hypothetical protein
MGTIAKLVQWGAKLEKAIWSCEYQDRTWTVSEVKLHSDGKLVSIKFTITADGITHEVVIAEHIVGGGDWLKLDGKQHDADHKLALKTKPLELTVKIKIKCLFDLDEKPGFEEVLYLATKIKL